MLFEFSFIANTTKSLKVMDNILYFQIFEGDLCFKNAGRTECFRTG